MFFISCEHVDGKTTLVVCEGKSNDCQYITFCSTKAFHKGKSFEHKPFLFNSIKEAYSWICDHKEYFRYSSKKPFITHQNNL